MQNQNDCIILYSYQQYMSDPVSISNATSLSAFDIVTKF